MEKDLEKMSKTMPYTVPEGFFDEMEERLMQEVAPKKTKSKARNVVLWTSLAVEMAFNQLSDSDQQLMLELFEEMDELDNY